MHKRRRTTALAVACLALAADAVHPADTIGPARTVRLKDGVEMAYLDGGKGGKGEPALVFVHCGNCRKEIWQETLEAFAPTHRVVAMDLPGHGRSGAGRQKWSLGALGADVAALLERIKLKQVVLVGNSLGGPVALEAARLLGPRRVRAVVAVDTLQDVEMKWPAEGLRKAVDAYRSDFGRACTALMLQLVPKDAPAEIRERIDRETCDNDARAATALLEGFGTYDTAAALRGAGVPVWAINSTMMPTALETNRKYSPSFQLILMEGVGHYPQVERPAEFQGHLRRVIESVTAAP
jgi:pimeloyl-ACP methyl ester carboxylesterase